jgi:hypothetical protein
MIYVALRQIEMLGLLSPEYFKRLDVPVRIMRKMVRLIALSSEQPDLVANATYWRLMTAVFMAYNDEIIGNAALIVLHNIAISIPLNHIICAVDVQPLLEVIAGADAHFLLRKSIAYVIFDIAINWPHLLTDEMRTEIIEMVKRRVDGQFALFVWNALKDYGTSIGEDLLLRNSVCDDDERVDPLARLWDQISYLVKFDD